MACCIPVLVDVLEEEAVGPDRQPRVDPLGAVRPLLRVELLQRLLDALQPVLGHVRHRRAEVEHAAAADGRRGLLLVGVVARGARRGQGAVVAAVPVVLRVHHGRGVTLRGGQPRPAARARPPPVGTASVPRPHRLDRLNG